MITHPKIGSAHAESRSGNRSVRHATTKTTAHPCLSRRRKDARPSELVTAAQELFFERGFAATRLEDVAEKAGVSKGTIYLYFQSKEILFQEVIRTGLEPAMTCVESLAVDAYRPPREQLYALLATWKEIMAEAPLGSLIKLLAAEARNFPDAVQWFNELLVRPARNVMIGVIQAGIASGDFRPTRPEMAADLFLSPVCLYALADAIGELSPPDQFLDFSYRMLLQGLDKLPAR